MEYINPNKLKENSYSRKMIPQIEETELIHLKRSIIEEGIREPIEVDEDYMILSGHERFRIAMEIGLDEVPIQVHPGLTIAEKKAFVILRNLERKHFSIGTRAMLAAELVALGPGRPKKGAPVHFFASDEVARRFGIGKRSLFYAREIMNSPKIPEELKQAVRDGRIPIRPVANLVSKPKKIVEKVSPLILMGTTVSKALLKIETPKEALPKEKKQLPVDAGWKKAYQVSLVRRTLLFTPKTLTYFDMAKQDGYPGNFSDFINDAVGGYFRQKGMAIGLILRKEL